MYKRQSLAIKLPSYALLYPFLELLLALSYLAHWQAQFTYVFTLVLMSFGALGVFRALRSELDINCACMGSTLNVPLSTVAVVENLGMTTMAVIMLLT